RGSGPSANSTGLWTDDSAVAPGVQVERRVVGAAGFRPGAESRVRARVQGQRLPWLLAVVEVADQITQHRRILAYVRTRVGTTVVHRVDPGAAEEVVLDELQVRVERQLLVVDEALPGVR